MRHFSSSNHFIPENKSPRGLARDTMQLWDEPRLLAWPVQQRTWPQITSLGGTCSLLSPLLLPVALVATGPLFPFFLHVGPSFRAFTWST